MKKRIILTVLLTVFFLNFVLATPVDDFENELRQSVYYAQQFESSNLNYAQFIYSLSSSKENINSILLEVGKDRITSSQITSLVGEPTYTNWVTEWDENTQVQLDESAPIWSQKIVFDGDVIQLKLSLIPVIFLDNTIIYSAEFSTIFKEGVTQEDISRNLNEIETLTQQYYSSKDEETKDQLAQKATFFEKLFETYYEKTSMTCEESMEAFLGSESLKSTNGRVLKDYLVSQKDSYNVVFELDIVDNYEGVDLEWVKFKAKFEKNSNELQLSTKTFAKSGYSDLETKEGVKAKLIEKNNQLNTYIDAGEFTKAYETGKEMSVLTQLLNDKINSDANPTLAFVDASSFFRALFEGYILESTSFVEKKVYEKTLLREYSDNGEEICMNNIDDNSNGKIDCADAICTGQICGEETVTQQVRNDTIESTMTLYCIEGSCQQKLTTPSKSAGICGDNICESNEKGFCIEDCPSCPQIDSSSCNGELIVQGEDSNGCPLETICLEDIDSCQTDSDCTQPLCGESKCISNICQITSISQCSQKVCSDGQKEYTTCSSGKKIATKVCVDGQWTNTNLACQVTGEAIEATEETFNVQTSSQTVCSTVNDCSIGESCVLGTCEPTPDNTYASLYQEEEILTRTGSTFTGNVIEIEITGDSITGTGITSAVGPADDDFLTEPNPSSIPQRTYEEGESVSRFTGIARAQEGELDIPETLRKTPEISSQKTLSQGVIEEFTIIGECSNNQNEKTASVYFASGGETFDSVADLMDNYRIEGPACDLELKKQVRKRDAIEKSFNKEFANWFYAKLANNANEWASQKQKVFDIYSEISTNLEEMALSMDCAGIKEVDFTPLYIDYQSEDTSFNLKYAEAIRETRLPGMIQEVSIPNPAIEVSLFLDKEFVKESLIISMNSHSFPSSSKERLFYGGLTEEELINLKNNPEIKSLMQSISSGYVDGYFDFQLSVIDKGNDEEVAYNLFGRVNAEEILLYPMNPDEVPTVDAKIAVGFEELYSLLKSSEEKNTYKIETPFDRDAFSITKQFSSFFDWIDLQLKTNSVMSSVSVTPSQKEDEAKNLFEKLMFLVAE